MLFANQSMIKNGLGIITIPVEIRDKFGEQLIKYYETDDITELKQFIYEYCIDGVEF